MFETQIIDEAQTFEKGMKCRPLICLSVGNGHHPVP